MHTTTTKARSRRRRRLRCFVGGVPGARAGSWRDTAGYF
jgi:hypothetical protein